MMSALKMFLYSYKFQIYNSVWNLFSLLAVCALLDYYYSLIVYNCQYFFWILKIFVNFAYIKFIITKNPFYTNCTKDTNLILYQTLIRNRHIPISNGIVLKGIELLMLQDLLVIYSYSYYVYFLIVFSINTLNIYLIFHYNLYARR